MSVKDWFELMRRWVFYDFKFEINCFSLSLSLLGQPDESHFNAHLEDDPVPGQPGQFALRPAVQGGVHGPAVRHVQHGGAYRGC